MSKFYEIETTSGIPMLINVEMIISISPYLMEADSLGAIAPIRHDMTRTDIIVLNGKVPRRYSINRQYFLVVGDLRGKN